MEAYQSGIDASDATAETSEAPVSDLPESLSDASSSHYRESAESSSTFSSSAAGKQESREPVSVDSTPDTVPDDFTRIVGIGPTYAGRLRNAGITTLSQVAGLEAGEIAVVLGCPASRVERATAGAGRGVSRPIVDSAADLHLRRDSACDK